MSTPSFVTFDCAGTLVRLRQPLSASVCEAAERLGVPPFPDSQDVFQALYQARLPEFQAINLTRDVEAGRVFWTRLAADWLERIGGDPLLAPALQGEVDRTSLLGDSMFELFPSTVPCLERLQGAGIRLGVISNWDYTLHTVLGNLGILEYFEIVLASLEEGWEKPDPRIFELALSRAGVPPEDAVHVGDHPVDDIQGASGVGMRAILIDHSGTTGDALRSLDGLEGHPLWNG